MTKKAKDIAIVRIEQLYPWPQKQIDAILKKYNNPKLVWVQEEPKNMGAWSYINMRINMDFDVISRRISASPATGFSKVHKEEQETLVKQAFEI